MFKKPVPVILNAKPLTRQQFLTASERLSPLPRIEEEDSEAVYGFNRTTYVNDGQEVWFSIGRDLVRCTVAQSMGHTARVVNIRREIDTWADIDKLLVRSKP